MTVCIGVGVVVAIWTIYWYVKYLRLTLASCPKCDGPVESRFEVEYEGGPHTVPCVCCLKHGGWKQENGDWVWKWRTSDEFQEYFKSALMR